MIFDGFTGSATVLGLDMANSIVSLAGANPQQNVLFAGVNFSHNDAGTDTTKSKYVVTATQGQNVILQCSYDMLNNVSCSDKNNTACYSHMGADSIPTVGNPTDDWLRDMMAQARTNHPMADLDPTPAGATDAKLWRLAFGNCAGSVIQIKADPTQTVNASLSNGLHCPIVSFSKAFTLAGRLNLPLSVRNVKLFDSRGRILATISVGKNKNLSRMTARAIAAVAKEIVLIKAQ
jgi:hypothetical protein